MPFALKTYNWATARNFTYSPKKPVPQKWHPRRVACHGQWPRQSTDGSALYPDLARGTGPGPIDGERPIALRGSAEPAEHARDLPQGSPPDRRREHSHPHVDDPGLRRTAAARELILPRHWQPQGAKRDRLYRDCPLVRHDLFGYRAQRPFPRDHESYTTGF